MSIFIFKRNYHSESSKLQLSNTSPLQNKTSSSILNHVNYKQYSNNQTENSLISKVIGQQTETIDLVMGIAQDIETKNFAVFVCSFRSVNDIAEIIIFINEPLDERINELAVKYKVTLVPFHLKNEKYPQFHPSTLRWPMMYKYLENRMKNSPKLGHVLFIDVRDSFFQLNPFDELPSIKAPYFNAYTGVETLTILNCGWNGQWVKDCFGQDMLGKIGNNRIICSGVSLADAETGFLYLEAMANIILGEEPYKSKFKSRFPMCERNGVDQVRKSYIS
jgi:hypothetical protein